MGLGSGRGSRGLIPDLYRRTIGLTHLRARLVRREHPFDLSAGAVALAFPRSHLRLESVTLADAPVQALLAQHAYLDVDHVQPAGVLGNILTDHRLKGGGFQRARRLKAGNSG